jgi:putative heme-binding domain-containing protein
VANDKNFVRLVDARTGEEIQRAYPPRNDVCQKVTWKLADHVTREVRLEIVDGDKGNSYAWLGVTRIEPTVVSVDDFNPGEAPGDSLTFLADLLKMSAPADLRDQLRPFLPPAPPAPPRRISEADRKRLDDLIASRLANFPVAKADADRGATIFKTHCAVCHRIGGEGGLIGPQLDGVGNRGAGRLAEDILDPNRNIDAHFYLTTLTRKDGTGTAGYLQAERGEVIELLDSTGEMRRILKNEIEARETIPVSLMPSNFGETLDGEAFRDLLGWLLHSGDRDKE